jgi:hypothetical protein
VFELSCLATHQIGPSYRRCMGMLEDDNGLWFSSSFVAKIKGGFHLEAYWQ